MDLSVAPKLKGYRWCPPLPEGQCGRLSLPRLVRQSSTFFLKGTKNSAISSQTLWIIFLAGNKQKQTATKQPDVIECLSLPFEVIFVGTSALVLQQTTTLFYIYSTCSLAVTLF